MLFADIAGSTAMLRDLGDASGHGVLLETLDVVRRCAETSGGRVIERAGDELLCLFDDPTAAATAASAMHLGVGKAAAKGTLPTPLRLRIAFLHGVVLERAQGIFGSTVHAAARLCALAKPGQTLTTKATIDTVRSDLRQCGRYFDTVALKGLTGEREVYELVWTPTATGVRHPLQRASQTGVALQYGTDTARVDGLNPYLEIGRHPACGVCVKGEAVSHLHVRLVWSRGRIRLEDVSTNGTIVQPEDGPSRFVHHDQSELVGRGVIKLGAVDDAVLAALVQYVCDDAADDGPPL